MNRKCLLVYVSACKPSEFVESLVKVENTYVILLFPISPLLPWVYNYYKTKGLNFFSVKSLELQCLCISYNLTGSARPGEGQVVRKHNRSFTLP